MKSPRNQHRKSDPKIIAALRKFVLGDSADRDAFLAKGQRPAPRRKPASPALQNRILEVAARNGAPLLEEREVAKSDDDRGRHPYDLHPMPGQRAAENAATRGDYAEAERLWERAVALANPDKNVVAATAAREPRRLDDSKQDPTILGVHGSDREPQNNPFLQSVANVTAQIQGSSARWRSRGVVMPAGIPLREFAVRSRCWPGPIAEITGLVRRRRPAAAWGSPGGGGRRSRLG